MECYNDKDIMQEVIKIESMVRDIYDAVVEREDKRVCPICNNVLRLYLPFGATYLRRQAMCPVCHSVERHRELWLYIQDNKDLFFKKPKENRLLHFAPELGLWNKFSTMECVDYYPVDINPKYYGICKAVDITDITYEDNYFDVIICNHVLEHITDDRKAIKELHRVLNSSGIAILNVPIKKSLSMTLEKAEYNTPELREKYYGQADHVRFYGNDYIQRLEESGFCVNVIHPNEDRNDKEIRKYGLTRNGEIYVCEKST